MAREALDDAKGDVEIAAAGLVARLQNDVDLLRAVIMIVIQEAVRSRVTHSMRQNRLAIVRNASPPGREAVMAAARGMRSAYLDWPLAGGVKLRDATRAQIIAQRDIHEGQFKTAGARMRWFELIAQHVPDGKVAGEVLTEDRVAELYVEAGGERD